MKNKIPNKMANFHFCVMCQITLLLFQHQYMHMHENLGNKVRNPNKGFSKAIVKFAKKAAEKVI